VPDPPYSEAELQAAVAALGDAERFREAEALVATAAPGLQMVLAEALASGGFFDGPQAQAIADAAGRADEGERLAAMRALLAEESRLAMMIGVAVGWTLASELGAAVTDPEETETKPKERDDR
jgi:hypothetical protein